MDKLNLRDSKTGSGKLIQLVLEKQNEELQHKLIINQYEPNPNPS